MPSDVLQQIDEEKQKLSSSGEIDPSLSSSLDELNEKASKSAQVMSVVESIWNSTASSGKNLHERISDLVKDFQIYESIVEKSIQGTSRLGSEYDSLGANGVAGVNRVNASLTQSLSLLQTVEREVKKYQSILASTPSIPTQSVVSISPPVQKFANGGRIQGTSKKGDKNLARVNAGEWVFTEKQVDNLRKITGASSSVEVFRMSGGIPGRSRKDSSGIPMYAEGKIGDSLRGREINTQLSSVRTKIEDRFNNSKTHESTKANLESLDESLREFDETLKNLSKVDFDRLGIDKRIETIFQKLSNGTKNGSRELQSITKQINAVIDIVNQDAEAIRQAEEAKAKAVKQAEEQKAEAIRQAEETARQAQLALDAIVTTDLSKFSGDARLFAESLERAKNISNSSSATAEEKENAKKEIQSSKSMLDLSEQKYLTRAERAQRQDIITRYKNAGSAEERELIGKEAGKLMEGAGTLERSITGADAAAMAFEKRADSINQQMKEFLGGTPTGVFAVGAAIGFAAKAAADLVNQLSSSVEQSARLSIESARLSSVFDSTFGKGNYNAFREDLGLTRKEMSELVPAIQDAYRSAGVELDHIYEVARNIKDEFGAMDPKMLQEALGVMKSLSEEQFEILLHGNGSSQDKADMYANLMDAGQAGKAADLLEQGIFGGENLSANISEGDKEIIENLKLIQRSEEEIGMRVKDGFGYFAETLPLAKAVSSVVTVAGQGFQLLATAKAIQMLVAQRNAQSMMPNAIGMGGGLKGVIGPGITAIVTAAIVSGFNMMQEHFEKQKRIKEAKKDKEIKDNYSATGIYTSNADLSIDKDAIHARGAKYGAWGTGIGGVVGGIAGTAAAVGTAGIGTLAGIGIGVGSAAAGGAAGYALGASLEWEKQLGDKANNPFLMTQDPTSTKESIAAGVAAESATSLIPGIGQVLAPIVGNAVENKTRQKHYNEALLTAASETTALVEEIRKIQDKNRSSTVKSLRLLETTGIIVKQVKSGKHSKFSDRMVESSKKNIDLMSVMGGTDDGYSGNVSSILENSTLSFSQNMKKLEEAQRKAISAEGVDGEAKVNATREILNQQADITKKFVESVYNSIGNYEKIPSVIQNSLKSKISSMALDFNRSNGVGTSALSNALLEGNLQRAGEDLVSAFEQYRKEKPQSDKAIEAANQQYNSQVSNLKKEESNLSRLGIGPIVENGKIDQEALAKGRQNIRSQQEGLDREIENRTGIKRFSHVSSVMEDLKSSSKTYLDLDNRLKDMDNEKFSVERENIVSGLKNVIKTDVEKLKAIIADEDIDQKYRDAAKKSLEGLTAGLDRISGLGNNFTLDQLKKNIPSVFSGAAENPVALYQKDVTTAESDPNIRKRRASLGQAEAALTAASQAHDAKTAALRNEEKMSKGLRDAANKAKSAADALANSIVNDPMVKFYDAQKGVLDASRDYMMSNGNYAEYLSDQLQNMNARLFSLSDAADKAQKSYEKQRSKLQSQLDDMVLNSSGEAEPLVRMLKELSDLQHKSLSDPNKIGEVMEKSNQINSYISNLKSKLENPEISEEEKKILEGLLSFAETMQMSLTALNGSGQTIKKTVAQVRSEQFKGFKEMIAKIGAYKGELPYMALAVAKERNIAQSNLSSANLNVGQVARLSEESRQKNAESYRKDLKGIETERSEMLKKLDEQFANPNNKMTQEEYSDQRSIIEDKSNQATAEAILKYQQAQVDAARREYDVKMKIVNLAEREVDIQLDVAQSIGAPMETIVALERQRVQLAEDAYNAAHKQYQDLVNSKATQEEIEEAKLKMQKAQADVIKNQLGAQRSMMEKVFGNMIGSFSENAGIMGPNNIARKYGYGYRIGKDGTVSKGGNPTGGYQSRIFANNALGNISDLGLPKREEIKNSTSSLSSKTSETGSTAPIVKPPVAETKITGAGGKTSSDSEFATLGEKFDSEKEGIEAAVFWEKKIYNVLARDIVNAIKGLGIGNNSEFIDATYKTQYKNSRERSIKQPSGNSSKNSIPTLKTPGIPTLKTPGIPTLKTPGIPTLKTPGIPTLPTNNVNGKVLSSVKQSPASSKLPTIPVSDSPLSSDKKMKYKLKDGVKLDSNEFFDENSGIIFHGGKKGIKKQLNSDGTYSVDNSSSYRRTLPNGLVLEPGVTDYKMSRKRVDSRVEPIQTAPPAAEKKIEPPKKETKPEEKKEVAPKAKEKKQPVSPIQAGEQKKHWSQVTWAHDVIKDYKQASPERKKKLLEELRAKYQQFNIADIKDGKMAQDARWHIDSANKAFNNASGWFGWYKELSDLDFTHAAMATNRLTNMLPVPAPAETPASAGTQPASTGTTPQGNSGGGKTTIEVQVKFNSQMFEQQVINICQNNAGNIVKKGTGSEVHS